MAGVAGRSGRLPKPVALKIVSGNPGRRKLNTAEPKYDKPKNIVCPEWMGNYGRELWEKLTPMLCNQGVLMETDMPVLEAYCDAYDQFRNAQSVVNKYGVLTKIDGGRIIKNPAVAIVREATAAMASYGSRLGLDPSSRQRLTGNKPPADNSNPFASLIAGNDG